MLWAVNAPLVVAHRGASQEFPEHTLAAFELAIEHGADAIECDVRLTADEHLVCVHDSTLDRTSNGRGPVSRHTLDELRLLDFRALWEGNPDTKHPVVTLHELLELTGSFQRPVGLSIETKHPSRHSLVLEQRVVEALRRHGRIPRGSQPSDPHAEGAVRVMSFSGSALRRMRAIAPSIPTVFLTSWPSRHHHERRLPHGATVLGPWLEWVRSAPKEIERLRDRGVPVHVWTVDDVEDIALCVDLGVDAIISNRPDAVLTYLGR